jgi:hypothetical protein
MLGASIVRPAPLVSEHFTTHAHTHAPPPPPNTNNLVTHRPLLFCTAYRQVVVRGSGGVALASAVNWYLNEWCNTTYDWNTCVLAVHCELLLPTSGHCWLLASSCWLLAAAGYCWPLLAIAGNCLVLVVVTCWWWLVGCF